jgi:hypothetical protein
VLLLSIGDSLVCIQNIRASMNGPVHGLGFLAYIYYTAFVNCDRNGVQWTLAATVPGEICRDENGFGIFRYSGNWFRNFSIGFIGNGIFRKRNRFSKTVSESTWCFTDRFLRLPFFVGNYRKLPDLCLGIFRNCVSEFSGIVSRNFLEFSSKWFFASPVRL